VKKKTGSDPYLLSLVPVLAIVAMLVVDASSPVLKIDLLTLCGEKKNGL
jgi:hypothetical protein